MSDIGIIKEALRQLQGENLKAMGVLRALRDSNTARRNIASITLTGADPSTYGKVSGGMAQVGEGIASALRGLELTNAALAEYLQRLG